MLLERGIRDISQVLILTRNSVGTARLVEDTVLHVYKLEGHQSFRKNHLIIIIMKAVFGWFFFQ